MNHVQMKPITDSSDLIINDTGKESLRISLPRGSKFWIKASSSRFSAPFIDEQFLVNPVLSCPLCRTADTPRR